MKITFFYFSLLETNSGCILNVKIYEDTKCKYIDMYQSNKHCLFLKIINFTSQKRIERGGQCTYSWK